MALHTDSTEGAAGRAGLTRGGIAVRVAVLLVVIALVGIGLWRLDLMQYRDPARLTAMLESARDVRALPVLFVLGYALAVTLGLPATPLTLAGGALFGVGLGSALNWTGALLGAMAAYGMARLVGAEVIGQLLGRHAKKLDRLSLHAGGRTVFRLRLVPVVPFNILNLAAGIARVPAGHYALATGVGILPGTIIYTYFADALLAGATGAREQALMHVIIAGVLLIAISFAPALYTRLRSRGEDAPT